MYQVLGKHRGQEYELGQYETEEVALQERKKAEVNGFYEEVIARDYDAYQRDEYAKLDQDTLSDLARRGDQTAREVLGAPALRRVTADELDQQIRALSEQRAAMEPEPEKTAPEKTSPIKVKKGSDA